MLKRLIESPRLDVFIAIVIALVSVTTAFSAWRASMVSSAAGDAIRQGMIDAVKKQTAENEDWRKTYEEANYAQVYAVTVAEVEAFEQSNNDIAEAQAKNLRQYLLPNLQLLGGQLASEEKYLKADGTFDLNQRFADLQAGSPDLAGLDPQAWFQLSDHYGAEQRWLTIGVVLLAISLFWLALSELSAKRSRLIMLIIGLGVYFFGLAWFIVVEVVFFSLRGGVL
jgi:hypothetical protein